MKRISAILLAGVAAFAVIATLAGPVPLAAGEMTTMVGGAPMYPSKNIVQNAVPEARGERVSPRGQTGTRNISASMGPYRR